jgi:hypothetical protein
VYDGNPYSGKLFGKPLHGGAMPEKGEESSADQGKGKSKQKDIHRRLE